MRTVSRTVSGTAALARWSAARARRGGALRAGVRPSTSTVPRRRPTQPGQRPEQGRLAGPVRADDRRDTRRPGSRGEVPDRGVAAVGDGQARGDDGGGGHGRRSSVGSGSGRRVGTVPVSFGATRGPYRSWSRRTPRRSRATGTSCELLPDAPLRRHPRSPSPPSSLLAAACGDAGRGGPPACGRGRHRRRAADDTADAGAAPGRRSRVVATTSILGDIVAELVGDDGEVTVLMGPGVDPHAYSPSARDAATAARGRPGGRQRPQLEESLLDTLEASRGGRARLRARPPGRPDRVRRRGRGTPTRTTTRTTRRARARRGRDHAARATTTHDDEGDDHGHDRGRRPRPRPRSARTRTSGSTRSAWPTGVELLAAELAAVATAPRRQEWEARGAAYADELRDDRRRADGGFAAVPEDRACS